MNIEVVKKDYADTQETFNFWFDDRTCTLYLTSYIFARRLPRARHFTIEKCYDRLVSRHNTIQEHEVPLSNFIKLEAIEKLSNQITVKLWSEKK